MVKDAQLFREHLDQFVTQYPELFPLDIQAGYHLHDIRDSQKLEGLKIRRIKLKEKGADGNVQVFSIQPSFVMPYMTGLTDEIEKALYLMQYAVPFSALTHVFGRNDTYWYRVMTHFGRYGIVQTTVQQPEDIPQELLADEKHSRFNGEKCYIATTVGDDCILGASVTLKADEKSLTEGYQTFKDEVLVFKPDYQPQTVNIDGWSATQNAWHTLFSTIIVIECFLHAFISIRARCKRKFKTIWPQIQDNIWDIYKAETDVEFLSRIKLFHLWAIEHVSGTALEAIHKLCHKSTRFVKWYAHQDARRTSNMIDRHMIPMDRWLSGRRYFHGHLCAAEKGIRSWSLLHNFIPYCIRANVSDAWISPAHKLNGKVYHQNWLHNLLVSTSASPVVILSHKKREN